MASSINASTAGSGGVITTADNSGVLNIQTAGTTAVTVDASQNVGIGTASPSTILDIRATAPTISVVTTAAYNATPTATLGFGGTYNSGGGLDAYGSISAVKSNATSGDGSAYLKFVTNTSTSNATEKMRITSGGVLSLNTTTTGGSTPGQQIIYYAQNTNWGMFINNTLNNSGSYAIGFGSGGNLVGRCETTASSTSYVTSSDYRLKENIAPMTGALAKVALLKPCTYTWKIDNTPSQGFIAHELQAVVPEAVNGEKDAVNEDGSIKPQGVDTSFLVATLTAAIQEQQAIITQLQADVAALKGAK